MNRKIALILGSVAIIGLVAVAGWYFLPFSTNNNQAVREEAWGVFERYIAFAKARDIEGVKSLSHSVSEACADPEREADCLVLIDSVATIGDIFQKDEFSNVVSNKSEVLLHSAAPSIAIIHFIRSSEGELKISAIRTCREAKPGDCDGQISLD